MSLSSLRSIFKTKKSKRHGKSKPSTAAATDLLALEIYSAHILLYSNPPSTISDNANAVEAMTTGDGSPATNSTCLLSGALSEFLRYSRQERSQWLIDIAHDICDPRFRRGSLVVWKDQQWLPVANTDPLTASEYRYDLPTMVTIGLSKISLRTGKSRTSASGNASTMASRVMQRDGVCWVSDLEDPILNSHICPKRLGDHTAQIIFETFTSTTPPPNLSIYNEIFGLNLSNNLGGLFDNHCLGFQHVAPNVYESHVFIVSNPNGFSMDDYTIYGRPRQPNPNLPPLHGHPAHPPQPLHNRNPPPGLFRWHYLQCVVKKFGHNDYKTLQNINFLELPFQMEGDSDDDSTDSEAQWPSMAFDLGRNVENSRMEHAERHQAVTNWISSMT
ncbi:hypothetical protein K443DRAFT_97209 [Laccaria amethystina LaAM-08-1]|uniref:Uncharacterized protein n=1 Tax=Laccaria amethystina LaAM-08-1 TaxID=1095629 RepID=A0A0C9XBI1_9AGAR|nr:hypothetical protein K443DRAFT_97209 [Laccaria amethystina LaAM-08-1]